MSNDEINRVIEDYLNGITRVKENDPIYYRTYYGGFYTSKKAYRLHGKAVKVMVKTGMSFEESLKVLIKESLIKKATELSETGVLTLESVKAAIKKREDDTKISEEELEEFMKSLEPGSSAPRIIAIWVIFAFLLSLAINLAFWGVITTSTGLQKGYWEFLFVEGLWTFLVGGIGAAVIMGVVYLIENF